MTKFWFAIADSRYTFTCEMSRSIYSVVLWRRKPPIFAVFWTSAFSGVANWQQSEKVEHVCTTTNLPRYCTPTPSWRNRTNPENFMKIAQGIRVYIPHFGQIWVKISVLGVLRPCRWWNLAWNAKYHPHRCNVSPLRGEKPQNRPLIKLNTGGLRCAQCCR